MKKLLITGLVVLSTSLVFSQKSKVTSAWNYLRDYSTSKDESSLEKAKEAIELATLNDETKGMAKTWLYRGDVYLRIFEHNLNKVKNTVQGENENQKLNGAYAQIPSTKDLEEAANSYKKTLELDQDKTYKSETLQNLSLCSMHLENRGVVTYNSKNYSAAKSAFYAAYEISTALGKTDTINLSNSALAAERSEDTELAKSVYKKMIELKVGRGNSYVTLAELYKKENNEALFLETIKNGRAAYPADMNLMIADINYYLQKGEQAKALESLKQAVEKDTNNANLRLAIANVYDNLANPKDESGKELEVKPANYEEMIKLAEENYLKSIEIDPNYFDALYNLGALYNNHGVYMGKKADAITDQAKYKVEQEKVGAVFLKAVPHLEKAHQLQPEDRATMMALRQIYMRTDQTDKAKEISDKLKK